MPQAVWPFCIQTDLELVFYNVCKNKPLTLPHPGLKIILLYIYICIKFNQLVTNLCHTVIAEPLGDIWQINVILWQESQLMTLLTNPGHAMTAEPAGDQLCHPNKLYDSRASWSPADKLILWQSQCQTNLCHTVTFEPLKRHLLLHSGNYLVLFFVSEQTQLAWVWLLVEARWRFLFFILFFILYSPSFTRKVSQKR